MALKETKEAYEQLRLCTDSLIASMVYPGNSFYGIMRLLLTPLAPFAVAELNDKLGALVATSRLANGYYPFTRKQTATAGTASCRLVKLSPEIEVAVTSRIAAMHDLADLERSVFRCLLHRPRGLDYCLSDLRPRLMAIFIPLIATHKDLHAESPKQFRKV